MNANDVKNGVKTTYTLYNMDCLIDILTIGGGVFQNFSDADSTMGTKCIFRLWG